MSHTSPDVTLKAADLRRQAKALEEEQATLDIDSDAGQKRHYILAVKINELLEEARKVERFPTNTQNPR